MGRSAFIIGGTGQIGRAVASRLLGEGWTVTLAGRTLACAPADLAARGARGVAMDRSAPGALSQAIGDGTDLLVDTVGYDAPDARQLVDLGDRVGQIVSISSASVYRDDAGRTLDEARTNGFPQLSVPIAEDQPVVAPGPATYSTRKVAMERELLDHARVPVAVLRPCAIHGPHSRHPREWWFVKRLLDRRAAIPLAYGGQSRFQTTATANIAALVSAVAAVPTTGIFNAADPDAPNLAEIAAAVFAATGRSARLLADPDPAYPPRMGTSPWSIPAPFVLGDAAARAIGYRPVGDYAATVSAACEWLMRHAPEGWERHFPVLASYPWNLFDYTAEDRWIARRSPGG